MPHIDIGTLQIEYSVVKGASRRYTYFRFKPDMTLEVSVQRGRKVNVEAMVKEKLSWIEREYTRATNAKRILGLDRVMFEGRYFRIVHIKDAKDELMPNLTTTELVVKTSDRRRIKELVRRWFLKETSAYVVRKVREYSPMLEVKPSRVDVREIGKWGYCTRTGRLSFNWQLVALPDRLREYVVFHELTHLFEFNHSLSFKKRLAFICPDYRSREKELAQIMPYGNMVLE